MKNMREMFDFFKNAEPEELYKSSLKQVVPAFQHAAEHIPAYRRILKERGINSEKIKTFEDFIEKVPILKKDDIFSRFSVSELCVDGNIENMASAIISSGFSKTFSYGIITKDDAKNLREMVDSFSDYIFDTSNRKTLIINSLGMGVNFLSSCPQVSTSVRTDTVLAFLKIFKNEFEQFIIFSDPHFAKKIVEDGIEAGLDWKSYDVSFVVGGDWISNSLVDYLMQLTGMNFDNMRKGQVISTMGLTELGLNIFHSTSELSRLRDIAQKNKELRYALFGEGTETCPEIMYYYPQRVFVETINKDNNGFGELILSMLDKGLKMPLFRYDSGDRGKIISYNELERILLKHNLSELLPELKLPIAAISGRNKFIMHGTRRIFAEDIREAIFKDKEVAGNLTGYFKLSKKQKPLIEIQLKENAVQDDKFKQRLERSIFDITKMPIEIRLYGYYDFPYGMKLDYESKFNCI